VGELRSDDLWEHPVLADCVARNRETDLPRDMLALAERAPGLLDLLDGLPLTFAPLRRQPAEPARRLARLNTFVVLDFGFGTLLPGGFDFGQLLVGLAHAGLVDPDEGLVRLVDQRVRLTKRLLDGST